jgi:hypothetical protein
VSAGLAEVPPRDGLEPLLEVLAGSLADRRSVGLEEVLSSAGLTTRVEMKYVVPITTLPLLLEQLPEGLAALDVGGRRIFAYQSVYFDTDDFALYRHHVQGRRKRYKVRSRSYCDTGDALFEVKLKGRRGETVKERRIYDFQHRDEMTPDGRAFVESVVADAYGLEVPVLHPALATRYRRVTLVDTDEPSRLTIDVGLSWSDPQNCHQADHLALIESKSARGAGPIDAALRSLGMRPERMSKYCLGIALLHPDTAANRWSRLLRQQLGRERTA